MTSVHRKNVDSSFVCSKSLFFFKCAESHKHNGQISTWAADWTESVMETTLIGRCRDVTMTSDDEVTRCVMMEPLPLCGVVNMSPSSCMTFQSHFFIFSNLYSQKASVKIQKAQTQNTHTHATQNRTRKFKKNVKTTDSMNLQTLSIFCDLIFAAEKSK